MADRTCSGCGYWSQWLPSLGDCMAYAEKRQEAMIAAEDMAAFRAEWPAMPARETDPGETCADFRERP